MTAGSLWFKAFKSVIVGLVFGSQTQPVAERGDGLARRFFGGGDYAPNGNRVVNA